MNVPTIQTHRRREQICGCQGGGEEEEGHTGSLGLAHTNFIHRMDILLHSPGSYPIYHVISHNGKECEKYISESLCCTAAINTTL